MKQFLIAMLISLPALAEDTSLQTLRDKKTIELIDRINKYCEESYPALMNWILVLKDGRKEKRI